MLSGSTLYGMTTDGGANNAGTIFALDLTPVPEPSSIVLLSIGAISLLTYAWRRHTKAS
jgi:uncharacterized repeat protein (TIGR03803 family)